MKKDSEEIKRALEMLRILEENLHDAQFQNAPIAEELKHARDALASFLCPQSILKSSTDNALEKRSPDDDA